MGTLVTIDPGLRVCGVAVFDIESKLLLAASLPRNLEAKDRGLGAWWQMSLQVRRYLATTVPDPLDAPALSGLPTHDVDLLVVECPQVYTAGKSKGDPNDLIEIAGVAARIAGAVRANEERSVLPREWKGTLDGDAMVERIQGRLSDVEHHRVSLPSAKSLQHNVYDAIGIGLHVLGRLAPRKVFPR